jgi:hypothetical protein
VLSDLHNEFAPYPHPVPDADVLVLAGDIDLKGRGVTWAAKVAAGRPVIYVPGNHEAYGTSLPRHIEKLQAAGAPLGVHVLDRGMHTVGSVRILGATLWTDFALFGTPLSSMADAAGPRGMTDYTRLRLSPSYRKLTPRDTVAWHTQSVRWLAQMLAARHASCSPSGRRQPTARGGRRDAGVRQQPGRVGGHGGRRRVGARTYALVP